MQMQVHGHNVQLSRQRRCKQSRVPFPGKPREVTFCSQLIESVRIIWHVYVVWLDNTHMPYHSHRFSELSTESDKRTGKSFQSSGAGSRGGRSGLPVPNRLVPTVSVDVKQH